MLSADSIRAQIDALLSGAIQLDDFEDEIVSSSWNQLQHAGSDVQQLIGAIELRLAEYSSGHLDHSDLLAELQALTRYGCVPEPVEAMFITIAEPVETTSLVTLTTVADGPEYHFRLGRQRTSPITRTGSARTIVQPRAAIA